ncbi:MAG TPA: hypothetical protein VL463_30475 [Kofleriaceae bacterium]|jgi:hypothetical protein|nr:hypothetical protein [Kofleriaceae bacterium]
MRRILSSVLVTLLATTGVAAAKGKAKPKPKAPTAEKVKKPTMPPVNAEHKKSLQELLGAFKFGMTKDEVVGVLTKQLDDQYAEKITATNDIHTQDNLRAEKKDRIAEITKTFVEFNGQKTGWDVSIIDDQFARNTNESMLVYWENSGGKNQRRFFFFYDGKLWKMFLALDSKQIAEEQRNFDVFRKSMEGRFGPGMVDPTGEEWATSDIDVKAVDRLRFYDAFCLVVTDPKRAKEVEATRAEHAPPPKQDDAIMKTVISKDPSDKPSLDENKDAVNAIIGNGKQKP